MSDSFPMCYKHVFSRLKGVRSHQKGWEALCPAHEDNKPSLSIKTGGNGKLIVKCHAPSACPTAAVLAALELTWDDLFPDNQYTGGNFGGKRVDRRIAEVYDYRDERDRLLFQVVRWQPKGFSQRRPNPDYRPDEPFSAENREWLNDVSGTRRVLYRLPELLDDVKKGEPIFLMEGEKAVNLARKCGLAATCSPGGARKDAWSSLDFVKPLRGATVVLVPDADPVDEKEGRAPGPAHMAAAGSSLIGWAARVLWLELPDQKEKDDWWDFANRLRQNGITWEDAGRITRELADQAPDWHPSLTPSVECAMGAMERVRLHLGRDLVSWYEASGIIASLLPRLTASTTPQEFRDNALRLAGVLLAAVKTLEEK